MPIKTFSDLPQSTYLSGMDVFAFQQDGTTKQIAASATNWVSSMQIDNMVQLTQSEYDAIGAPDPSTLYIIAI